MYPELKFNEHPDVHDKSHIYKAKNPLAYANRTMDYFKAGKYELALLSDSKRVREFGADDYYIFTRGLILEKLERYEEAISVFKVYIDYRKNRAPLDCRSFAPDAVIAITRCQEALSAAKDENTDGAAATAGM